MTPSNPLIKEQLELWLSRMEIIDKSKGYRKFTIKDYSDLLFIIKQGQLSKMEDVLDIIINSKIPLSYFKDSMSGDYTLEDFDNAFKKYKEKLIKQLNQEIEEIKNG